jgi:hypothetical protein
MTDFKNGDRVRALDPDAGGEMEGNFEKVTDPDASRANIRCAGYLPPADSPS